MVEISEDLRTLTNDLNRLAHYGPALRFAFLLLGSATYWSICYLDKSEEATDETFLLRD
jgi:hypothetical protein